MSELYYNTDYFKKYNSAKYIFFSIGVPLVMWCFIIYFFIILPKEVISLFQKIVLCFPFIYVIYFFIYKSHNSSFYFAPELHTGCLKFPNEKRSKEDGLIGKWYWECSMEQVYDVSNWLKSQTENASNLCYGLLLLMLVTTSFKINMLDIPIIKSFSIILLIITTIILYVLPFGVAGPSVAFLIIFNSVLTTIGISSFLIVLLNLHRLK